MLAPWEQRTELNWEEAQPEAGSHTQGEPVGPHLSYNGSLCAWPSTYWTRLPEKLVGHGLCPLGVCLEHSFPGSCDSPAFIHLPGASLAGGQWAELWEKRPGRPPGEGSGEKVDGGGEQLLAVVPSLQAWPGLPGGHCGIACPTPLPPASPQPEAGHKTAGQVPLHLPSEALSLHFENLSENASGFLLRTGQN